MTRRRGWAVSKYGTWFGWWVGYFASGAKRCEGEFVDGLKVGQWTYYYPNGEVSEQGAYETGERQGNWVEYGSRGVKRAEGIYVAGKRFGEWREWICDGVFNGVTRYKEGQAPKWIPAEQLKEEEVGRNRVKPWLMRAQPAKRPNPSSN